MPTLIVGGKFVESLIAPPQLLTITDGERGQAPLPDLFFLHAATEKRTSQKRGRLGKEQVRKRGLPPLVEALAYRRETLYNQLEEPPIT
jgi:hypothetical protein